VRVPAPLLEVVVDPFGVLLGLRRAGVGGMSGQGFDVAADVFAGDFAAKGLGDSGAGVLAKCGANSAKEKAEAKQD